MREMLAPTSAIMGKRPRQDVALITDGRFSGGSHGFVVGHITPEAYEGGTIALLKDGDPITIDAKKRTITLSKGVLAKYAVLVRSASEGAVTDKDLNP
jgi:dihydroxy-acid dehydratase